MAVVIAVQMSRGKMEAHIGITAFEIAFNNKYMFWLLKFTFGFNLKHKLLARLQMFHIKNG